ncbi:MNNG and nitrosoguanidine resistance protein [Aspergillus oryzae 100-8]|nr:MNNG and nitrosoguanidine resistance protein [Aspergillus oryzae 100-8]
MSEKTEIGEGSDKVEVPPNAVSFFDPALRSVRRQVFMQWGRTVLTLCVFILCILSLYWAVQFRVEQNLHSLTVWVVDFDGMVDPYRDTKPIVGPAVTDVAENLIQTPETGRLGYTIKSPDEFNYDPWAVRQGVYDEHAYAAIIVNANATTLLHDAVKNGNSSYDPTGAAQFVVITARDETTYSSYITPGLTAFASTVLAEFGPRWVQTVAQESLNISNVPQAINPAIGFNTVDLRPFGPAAATPSVTIGLIYLIIIAFFNSPFLMPIHAQFLKGNHPPLKIPQWLLWRVCSNITAYFFLSLFYSFVSLAFQIPFSNSPAPDTVSASNPNAYGHGSFVVFWMLNWVGMSALGFPLENMAMVLGFPCARCSLYSGSLVTLQPGSMRWTSPQASSDGATHGRCIALSRRCVPSSSGHILASVLISASFLRGSAYRFCFSPLPPSSCDGR